MKRPQRSGSAVPAWMLDEIARGARPAEVSSGSVRDLLDVMSQLKEEVAGLRRVFGHDPSAFEDADMFEDD